jgi:hypothetical protein
VSGRAGSSRSGFQAHEAYGVSKIFKRDDGSRVAELRDIGSAGSDGNYPSSTFDGCFNIADCITDDYGRFFGEGGPMTRACSPLGDGDEIGANGIVGAVGATFEIEKAGEPESIELDLGGRLWVARQHRLSDLCVAGERLKGFACSG